MKLTAKFRNDAMHYWVKDNAPEWADFEKEYGVSLTIDNRNLDKNDHTIEFFISFMTYKDNSTRGTRYSFTVIFSRVSGEYIRTTLPSRGRTVRTDVVETFTDLLLKFISGMIEHGYLN